MSIIAEAKEQTLLSFSYDPSVEYIEGDLQNIREMLPKLYPHQQEDVLKIEQRFQVGKGYLCTHGTGYGKTGIGLGTAKRFASQGKVNILIVVPTEAKSIDWIKDAELVELMISMIEGTKDAGQGIVLTTYANFYQNHALDNREWDLIIYDECHYLNQNFKGEATVYHMKHRKLANLPSTAKEKAKHMVGDSPAWERTEEWQMRATAWRYQMQHYVHSYIERTKVLFLSATPFAYHKSVKYADGCLFDIMEVVDDIPPPTGYNAPNRWQQFMIENFGYRMDTNRLTIPEVGVDQGLMEREFFDKHVELGVMSTRILELDQDYSRDFIKVDSEIGHFIDEGISMWNNTELCKKYKYLSEIVDKKYNYLFVNQLLEAIKAKQIVERIKQHLALGRKVVVFHGYNHTTMEHPFHFVPEKLVGGEKWMIAPLRNEIRLWEQEFPQFANLDLHDISNTRKTLKAAFPNILEFNGTVPKKKRKENENKFKSDKSGPCVIMVQSKSGKEGISLHDMSGRYQRVLINLSLPVLPTEAIQTEGRIYRSGVITDAIYEYITLHTNFEKEAFATKIAQRSKTAENLAMGHLARDLETSFKEGYISAHNHEPYLGQGRGGKERDRIENTTGPFEKAKTYYFARAKKKAANKAFEGVDYFATPEPLGYKMVEWLNPQPSERGLEPSAGHGAIGRFFPAFCENTFIEPSINLYSDMKLLCDGRGECQEFEYFSINNKYDYIAMNPPFGFQGKTAMEHIAKAVIHMAQHTMGDNEEKSRLLAIIPCGPAMDKRLAEFMESKAFKDYSFTGEILLPSCTFNRAGTSVMTRIIRIQYNPTSRYGYREEFGFNKIDLREHENITEFFEAIEHLSF